MFTTNLAKERELFARRRLGSIARSVPWRIVAPSALEIGATAGAGDLPL
jgi:hypothetical protein